jgi:hypothetical protein
VLDHRPACDLGEWLARKASGIVSGGNDGDNL